MQLGGLQERDPVLCSRSDEVAVWAVPSSGPGAEGALGAVAVLLTPPGPQVRVFLPILPFANEAGNSRALFPWTPLEADLTFP